jgi:hypothetical protein
MAEAERRVWWRLTDTGYAIEVRHGARVMHKTNGEGSREEMDEKIRELDRSSRAV